MKQHEMSCPYPEGCNCGASEWNRLESSLMWYKTRVELLEASKLMFREPERTILIDVLANGQLLPDPNGIRYTLLDKPQVSGASEYQEKMIG